MVQQAYALALGGQIQQTTAKVRTRKPKPKPKYQENDIRQTAENAKKNKTTAYEGLKSTGIIKDPVQDFITIT